MLLRFEDSGDVCMVQKHLQGEQLHVYETNLKFMEQCVMCTKGRSGRPRTATSDESWNCVSVHLKNYQGKRHVRVM
ncbi:solute carrier organic anion transporter family member 2B1 X3 [Biomphalaria glabrata]|nr:solute carrier organic anion transporter family member 2B1 X3 [Biomphalaria glabrata]